MKDLGRWSQHLGIPLNPNPHLATTNKDRLLQGALAAKARGLGAAYVEIVFRACWADAYHVDSDDALAKLLEQHGLADAAGIVAAARDVAPALEDCLAQAEADGCFGVPSFCLDRQLFFGNDRMMFLEKALTP